MRPQDLLPSDVYQWMGRKPTVTANRYRAVLLNVMKVCVKHGALDRNPIREVDQNPEEPRERYVEDAEVDAFLKCCTPLLTAYVKLKLITGLRQGQLLAPAVHRRRLQGALAVHHGQVCRGGGERFTEHGHPTQRAKTRPRLLPVPKSHWF